MSFPVIGLAATIMAHREYTTGLRPGAGNQKDVRPANLRARGAAVFAASSFVVSTGLSEWNLTLRPGSPSDCQMLSQPTGAWPVLASP